MNLGYTVNDLKKFCEEMIKQGNGDKHIIISDDDEGNAYHTLFYGFTTIENSSKENMEFILTCEHDGTHTIDNCVVLG